jgi:SAM-dependent methyltransferase
MKPSAITERARETQRTDDEFHYVGSELDLFAAASNWKAYWAKRIGPYLQGDTLEVGAGIGSNTSFLSPMVKGRWVCLEPDPSLSAQLAANLTGIGGTARLGNVCGTLESLAEDERFDTILYIDVLEHIEDDAGELRLAAARLRPGGRVIVLSPAHQFLYTPFDAAIGHFRRYNRSLMRKVSPPELALEALFYLDACGVAASAANRMLLRQSMPTKSQIGVWDKWIVPTSRLVDPILRHSVGKSIVGVWRRPPQAE